MSQFKIWKINQKVLKQNFKNLFRSFFPTSTLNVCAKFHENQRKTVEGLAVWKKFDDTQASVA